MLITEFFCTFVSQNKYGIFFEYGLLVFFNLNIIKYFL